MGVDLLDLLVVGGGVNGAGIARDAAGRGLKVLLCEKNDLAQGTSSRSSKLIHGGLRYLEYYEFRLVREALIEREVLLRAAPHIVWPLRFVLPHSPEQRPAWMVRTGLFLYDHLGGRDKLPGSRSLDLRRDPEGSAIRETFTRAFEYSDCFVDDARLVALNAVDAREHGATVLTRTGFVSARRDGDHWRAELRNADGTVTQVAARAIVNAAGPWVEKVIAGVSGITATDKVRLVKGSHLITRKFWDGPQAYILQNQDKRVIFVIPYEGDMALIGTTDIPYQGAADAVAIDAPEIDYLLAAVNRYTRTQLSRADILASYSGVRPLHDDNSDNPSAVSRDYVLEVDGRPPLLSVFGGKITTYRKLAEAALGKLKPFFPAMTGEWTATAHLPGGDMPNADFDAFLRDLKSRYPWLTPSLAHHYARLYGTRAPKLIGSASALAGLGRHFGGDLYDAEIAYLRDQEWLRTAEDLLYRRTKHGLHLSEAERAAVVAYMG